MNAAANDPFQSNVRDIRSTEPVQFRSGDGNGGGRLEARVAKLEAAVEHIQTDVADLKVEVRSIRDKIDALNGSIGAAKVWAVLLYAGLIVLFFGAMGTGYVRLSDKSDRLTEQIYQNQIALQQQIQDSQTAIQQQIQSLAAPKKP